MPVSTFVMAQEFPSVSSCLVTTAYSTSFWRWSKLTTPPTFSQTQQKTHRGRHWNIFTGWAFSVIDFVRWYSYVLYPGKGSAFGFISWRYSQGLCCLYPTATMSTYSTVTTTDVLYCQHTYKTAPEFLVSPCSAADLWQYRRKSRAMAGPSSAWHFSLTAIWAKHYWLSSSSPGAAL